MTTDSTITQRLNTIQTRIAKAAENCGRNPDDIKLVAVSKTKPAQVIKEAFEAGARLFGENYIQESLEKHDQLKDLPLSFHFIGHLQSNKSKFAVRVFDLIHSVDSLKLAREINKQAEKIGKTQDVLVQVNISMEDSKSGVTENDAEKLVRDISSLPHISVKGLMTLPPYYNEPALVRPYFSALKKLRDYIRELRIPGVSMDELSMGMTGDFEVAIEEGATLVRIGTALFGERS